MPTTAGDGKHDQGKTVLRANDRRPFPIDLRHSIFIGERHGLGAKSAGGASRNGF